MFPAKVAAAFTERVLPRIVGPVVVRLVHAVFARVLEPATARGPAILQLVLTLRTPVLIFWMDRNPAMFTDSKVGKQVQHMTIFVLVPSHQL